MGVYSPFRHRRRRRPFKQSEKWFQARAQNLSDCDGRTDGDLQVLFSEVGGEGEGRPRLDTISIMSKNKAGKDTER